MIPSEGFGLRNACAGAAYIFSLDGSTWKEEVSQLQKLERIDP